MFVSSTRIHHVQSLLLLAIVVAAVVSAQHTQTNNLNKNKIKSKNKMDCDCLADPSQMCCMHWTYENAANDVTSMCKIDHGGAMMFACGIDSYCKQHSLTSSDKNCNPMSILSDICIADSMSSMSGCTNFTKLCSPSNTMVSACTSFPQMPKVLTTANSKQSIISMCTSMSGMSECMECVVKNTTTHQITSTPCNCNSLSSSCVVPASSSLLQILSDLCLSMPMSECEAFSAMCGEAGENFETVCGSSAHGGGGDGGSKVCSGLGTVMYMDGFKGTLEETDTCVSFLFTTWILDSRVKLAFGIIGAFLLGIFQSALAAYLRIYNRTHPLAPRLGFADLGRLALFLVEITNSYVLMLLAMTYFSGFFVAVVCGLAFGRTLFCRVGVQAMGPRAELDGPVKESTCCEQ